MNIRKISKQRSKGMKDYHPALMIQGIPLRDAGFEIGNLVEVEFGKNVMIVRKLNENKII